MNINIKLNRDMILYNYFEIGQQKNIILLIGITTAKSEIVNRQKSV